MITFGQPRKTSKRPPLPAPVAPTSKNQIAPRRRVLAPALSYIHSQSLSWSSLWYVCGETSCVYCSLHITGKCVLVSGVERNVDYGGDKPGAVIPQSFPLQLRFVTS